MWGKTRIEFSDVEEMQQALNEQTNLIIDNQMMNISPPIQIHSKSKAIKRWLKVPWKKLYTKLSP